MNKFKLFFLSTLLFVTVTSVWAQDELWYFGRGNVFNGAGLQFPGPTARNFESFNIYEAITVISDGSGNALFYSDGLKVFNKNNVQMPSGGGLLGSQENNVSPTTGSSLNGVLAFKKPGSTSEYYIFTINDCLNSTRNGFRYNVVDMTLNGGLGDVSSKNNIILDGSTTPTAEMMAAASKPCSDTIWVIVHGAGNNNFYAVPVSPAGVGTPVISSVGPNIGMSDDRRGSFAFNSDASQLAMASMNGNGGYIFNFNPSTGVVTTTTLGVGGTSRVSTKGHYGCAWSPDDKMVYFTSLNSDFVHFNTTLPYNAATNPSLIATGFYGAVKKGADGKLYVGENMTNFLGTISNPNAANAASCGWDPNGFSVGTLSWYGLPNNFIPQSGGGSPAIITNPTQDTTVCSTDPSFQLSASPSGGNWSSSPSGFVNGSGVFNPGAGSGNGPWVVKLYYGNPPCLLNDSVTITVNACCPPVSTSPINDTCAGSTIDLSTHVIQGTGTWSIVSGTGGSIVGNNFSSNTAGAFTVRYTLVPDPGGNCTKYSEQTFNIIALPVVSVADHAICSGDPAWVFDAGAGFTTYSWTGPVTGSSRTLSTSIQGTYTITVTQNGCTNSDQATLTINAKPSISLANASVCPGTAHTFDAGVGYTYIWSDNGTGTAQTTTGSIGGNYTVIVTDGNGCKDTATGTLTVYTKPNVSVADAAICVGDPAHTFTATGGFSSYVWSDNGIGTAQSTTGSIAGAYTVTVTDGNGCKDTATANLTVNILPQVTLADTSTCPGGAGVTLIPSPAIWNSYLWSDNSTNSTLTVTIPNQNYSVEVTDANGCKNTATAFVAMGDTLHVDFGGPKDVCANQSIVLDAATYGPFSAPITYTWFGGTSSSSTLAVNSSGLYGVVVMDGRGCLGGDTVSVTIRPLPTVDLGNDTSICFTGKEVFNITLPNIYKTRTWSNGSKALGITVKTPSAVSVVVTNNFDCLASDTLNLSDYCKPTKLCFPNVITPNGDGTNDEFIPCYNDNDSIYDGNYKGILNNILKIDFQVYDRWGVRVFQSKNVLPRWNGTYQDAKVADGVYYYIVRYTDSAHNVYEQTGWVQVIDNE